MNDQANFKELRERSLTDFKLNGISPCDAGYDQAYNNLSQASALLTVLAVTMSATRDRPNNTVLSVAFDGIRSLIDSSLYELELERKRD